MNDRFRSRKHAQSHHPHHHDCEHYGMDMNCLEAEKHKTKERRVHRIRFYRGFAGSRLAKLSLLAIHVAIFFTVRFLYRNGYFRSSHQHHVSSFHEPPKWAAQEWSLSESFAAISDSEQQKMINSICSERKVVTPLQNKSSSTISEGIPWTICMTINAGFYDFFQNWYKHFELLGLKMDLVLFAEDSIAYDKLSSATFLDKDFTMVVNATNMTGPSHVITHQVPAAAAARKTSSSPSADESAEDSASSDKVFDAYSPEYKQLISNRPTRLLQVLCSGRNVLYIDTDTVLRKSPLPIINEHYMRGVDISIALDHVTRKKYAHGFGVCTGFVAIKANPKTVQFVSEWERNCHDEGSGDANNDQTAFNRAYESFWLKRQEFGSDIIKLHGLPIELFPNGQQYFKKYDSHQREKVVLVHANWIVGGDKKRRSLMKHHLWDPLR